MTTLRKALPVLAVVALWAFTSHPAYAQATDCSFTRTFTGNLVATSSSNLSGNVPCVNWRVTYSVTGTLAATVAFQTSPDNITFTAVPNTICSASVQPPCVLQGSNPLTGTTQGMSLFASYGSYVRVVITGSSGAGTGTIRGYGAKGTTASFSVPAAAGAGTGTVTNTGVLTLDAIVTGNGGADIKTPCAACTLSAAGDVSITGTLSTGAGGGTAGSITMDGSTSGSVTLQAAAVQGTPNPIQFPTATGAAGSLLSTNGANPQQTSWVAAPTIASGAKALATAAIASATCTAAQTDTATGVATTDAIIASFNGDPTAVTGYIPLTAGMLTTIVYPTANLVNFKICNNTTASITPGAITINWRVVR